MHSHEAAFSKIKSSEYRATRASALSATNACSARYNTHVSILVPLRIYHRSDASAMLGGSADRKPGTSFANSNRLSDVEDVDNGTNEVVMYGEVLLVVVSVHDYLPATRADPELREQVIATAAKAQVYTGSGR